MERALASEITQFAFRRTETLRIVHTQTTKSTTLSGWRLSRALKTFSRKVRKETIDKRFAAEASKNLENADSNSDLLDRGCVSRRRNFYHKEHKETIAYRFA